MRFSGKMFGWTAGFSALNLEDLHEDVQVLDSKAILGRFAGGTIRFRIIQISPTGIGH